MMPIRRWVRVTSAIGEAVSGFSGTPAWMCKGSCVVRQTNEAVVGDGFQAITSLSRALGGRVELTDVGSLLWVVLRQMVPCETMALFVPDRARRHLIVRYAAGAHAELLGGLTRPLTSGIAGWVAINQRAVLNSEPMFDLGVRGSAAPSLRSSVVVPLMDNGTVVAVLALYSKDLLAFTDEHASLLELLGPRLAVSLADAARAQIQPAVDSRLQLRLVMRPS
jgi:GAF domain-containing protein